MERTVHNNSILLWIALLVGLGFFPVTSMRFKGYVRIPRGPMAFQTLTGTPWDPTAFGFFGVTCEFAWLGLFTYLLIRQHNLCLHIIGVRRRYCALFCSGAISVDIFLFHRDVKLWHFTFLQRLPSDLPTRKGKPKSKPSLSFMTCTNLRKVDLGPKIYVSRTLYT